MYETIVLLHTLTKHLGLFLVYLPNLNPLPEAKIINCIKRLSNNSPVT